MQAYTGNKRDPSYSFILFRDGVGYLFIGRLARIIVLANKHGIDRLIVCGLEKLKLTREFRSFVDRSSDKKIDFRISAKNNADKRKKRKTRFETMRNE